MSNRGGVAHRWRDNGIGALALATAPKHCSFQQLIWLGADAILRGSRLTCWAGRASSSPGQRRRRGPLLSCAANCRFTAAVPGPSLMLSPPPAPPSDRSLVAVWRKDGTQIDCSAKSLRRFSWLTSRLELARKCFDERAKFNDYLPTANWSFFSHAYCIPKLYIFLVQFLSSQFLNLTLYLIPPPS